MTLGSPDIMCVVKYCVTVYRGVYPRHDRYYMAKVLTRRRSPRLRGVTGTRTPGRPAAAVAATAWNRERACCVERSRDGSDRDRY